MVAATLYQTVYLIVVLLMTIYITRQYATIDFLDADKGAKRMMQEALILAILLIFIVGFRPVHWAFGDTIMYDHAYKLRWGLQFVFKWETTNYIFDNILNYFASQKIPIGSFFFFISFIYFAFMLWACLRLFPNDILMAFIVYLGAFSTFSYGTNGIKAGAAASLFLVAIAYRDKKLVAALFLFLSLGFHHSMAVCLAAFLLPYFVKDRKYYIYAWIACLVMAALGITSLMSFLGGYADEQGASYLNLNKVDRDVSGFRPDFILYSAIPIFLGEYLLRKFEIESEEYDFIWKVYVATNAVFLICTYGSYINRIAYLSWQLYPIVLIYPFLRCDLGPKQYTYLKYAVYGHIGFTIFMNFIYYA